MPKWYGGSVLNLDEIISPGKQWISQWCRVQRYHEQSKSLRKKSLDQELSAGDMDDLIAFFMNAFHLRDWVLDCHPKLKSDLDKLFGRFEMGCCRDIANGFKHKKISKASVEPDFNLFREHDYLDVEKNPIKYRIAFWDKSSKEIRKWEIFDLIDVVYEFWGDFIRTNRILHQTASEM